MRGLSLVTSWREHPAAILGRTKGHLLRWLAAKVESGETWLDIGTRSGYTALAISHLVGAVRGLMTGGPVATDLMWTLVWMAILLVVFFPLALRAYRRRA